MKLTEIYAVADTFATGLGRVDVLSAGFARFVWYVERKNDDGEIENVVIDCIVMPLEAVPDAILMAAAATAGEMAHAARKRLCLLS